jgi:hypothetical protein
MNLFTEHGPDCTPLVPCRACEIVAWLRTKLSEEDFSHLVESVNDFGEAKPKRVYKRRDRIEAPDITEQGGA